MERYELSGGDLIPLWKELTASVPSCLAVSLCKNQTLGTAVFTAFSLARTLAILESLHF